MPTYQVNGKGGYKTNQQTVDDDNGSAIVDTDDQGNT